MIGANLDVVEKFKLCCGVITNGMIILNISAKKPWMIRRLKGPVVPVLLKCLMSTRNR
jgi:hypothetical protein